MEDDFKKEARKRYLCYFRFWFIAIAVLAAGCGVLWVNRLITESKAVRGNNGAPAERVYDYADVLTDAEEERLRQKIAKAEKRLNIDIVLVTISRSVEGAAAKEEYGYRSEAWETNMMDIADDFWDENGYGYNRDFEGDGVLLLHNWYPGQNGEHLSTSGRAEDRFSDYDIDRVLNAVDKYYETNPYRAYRAYIDEVCRVMDANVNGFYPWAVVFLVPLGAACIYAAVHLKQKKAENTTAVNAYVAGGKPVMRARTDDFIRKSVVTRHIQTSSGGGSGGRSGGAGHHVSRSGASHGGGSHRH